MPVRDDLLVYYERELSFLRQMGAEFADKYPKIAGRLLIDDSTVQIVPGARVGFVGRNGVDPQPALALRRLVLVGGEPALEPMVLGTCQVEHFHGCIIRVAEDRRAAGGGTGEADLRGLWLPGWDRRVVEAVLLREEGGLREPRAPNRG